MGKKKKQTWEAHLKQVGFIKSCNPKIGPDKWRGSVALDLAKAPAKWKKCLLNHRCSTFLTRRRHDALTCDTRDMTILSWNAGNLARDGIDVKTGIKQESDIGTYLAGKVHLKIIQEACEIDKVM